MPGYRVARYTNSYSYNAVNGQMKIPSYYAVKPESYSGAKDGVFLEFFYVFEAAGYGLDIGILNNGKGWSLFAGSNAVNNTVQWVSGRSIPLQPNNVIQIAAYLNGTNAVQLKVTLNSVEYYLDAPLVPAAYEAFKSGCRIRREMNVVPQGQNRSYLGECSYLPSNVYYISGEWFDTTLNVVNGGSYPYAFMTNQNSYQVVDKDTDVKDKEFDETDNTSVMVQYPSNASSAAVKDTCSIDFRNRSHCK